MKYFVKTVKLPHLKPGASPVDGVELHESQRIVSVVGATAPLAGATDIELIVLIEESPYFARGGLVPFSVAPVETRDGC
jgi:hypothetical protein